MGVMLFKATSTSAVRAVDRKKRAMRAMIGISGAGKIVRCNGTVSGHLAE